MPNLVGRALAAKQEQDTRSAELQASWLARSRADAVRRWESTLGPTQPEDWRPCAPQPFEQDHLRITVDGFVFTQEHRYSGGQHRWWLALSGSSETIESEYDLHRALGSMRPWSLLAARVRNALTGGSTPETIKPPAQNDPSLPSAARPLTPPAVAESTPYAPRPDEDYVMAEPDNKRPYRAVMDRLRPCGNCGHPWNVHGGLMADSGVFECLAEVSPHCPCGAFFTERESPPDHCTLDVWLDGTYRAPCGYRIVNGECLRHGKVGREDRTHDAAGS